MMCSLMVRLYLLFIMVFDHLSNVLSEQSLAAANISYLVKIADEETLDIVLRAACQLMVQLQCTREVPRTGQGSTTEDYR